MVLEMLTETCSIFVLGLVVILSISGVIPTNRNAGFFVNDYSISFPLVESSGSYVLLVMLSLAGFVILFFSLFLNKSKLGVQDIWRNIRMLTLNIGLNLASNLLMKSFFGRLRPHFLNVCKPIIDEVQSTPSLNGTYSILGYFLMDYHCVERDVWNPSDIYQSFPSSFSSITSSICFISAVPKVYLYYFLWIPIIAPNRDNRYILTTKLVGLVIYALLTFCALWEICSSVFYHNHHWEDVIVGTIFGLVMGFLHLYLVIYPVLWKLNKNLDRGSRSNSEIIRMQ